MDAALDFQLNPFLPDVMAADGTSASLYKSDAVVNECKGIMTQAHYANTPAFEVLFESTFTEGMLALYERAMSLFRNLFGSAEFETKKQYCMVLFSKDFDEAYHLLHAENHNFHRNLMDRDFTLGGHDLAKLFHNTLFLTQDELGAERFFYPNVQTYENLAKQDALKFLKLTNWNSYAKRAKRGIVIHRLNEALIDKDGAYLSEICMHLPEDYVEDLASELLPQAQENFLKLDWAPRIYIRRTQAFVKGLLIDSFKKENEERFDLILKKIPPKYLLRLKIDQLSLMQTFIFMAGNLDFSKLEEEQLIFQPAEEGSAKLRMLRKLGYEY